MTAPVDAARLEGVDMRTPWNMRYSTYLGFPSAEAPMFHHLAGSADPVALIDFVADLGFVAVEDSLYAGRPPEQRARIAAAVARRGLEMGCFGFSRESFFQPLIVSDEPAARDRLVADIELATRLADEVSSRLIMVSGKRDNRVPLGYQTWNAIENLKRMGDVAARRGKTLVVECVSPTRIPEMMFQDIDHTYLAVKAVGMESVRIVFDAFHVQAHGGNLIANLRRCWDMVAAIQVSDAPDRHELGAGELNFVNFFRELNALDYRGFVGIEVVPSRPGRECEVEALRMLRRIDAEVGARRG